MIKFYVTDVNIMNEKVEIPTYMNETEEHFLYVIHNHSNLCQYKWFTNKIYPPENIYGYFGNLLKIVAIKKWYGIAYDRKKYSR